jgi:hypothetical protein
MKTKSKTVLHRLGFLEGKPNPPKDPFFGTDALAPIKEKKVRFDRLSIRCRRIRDARRRYVLGDNSAFDET